MVCIESRSKLRLARRGIAWLVVLVTGTWLVTPVPVAQTSYTYTVIANLAEGDNASAPAINASGQVAFSSASGVQRGDGSTLTPLYSGGFGSPNPNGPVSINAGGAVAFYASSFTIPPRIIVADGVAPESIVADGGVGAWFPIGSPSINDAGQVVFAARNGADLNAFIVTGNFVPIVSPGEAIPGGPALNNNAQLAYSAALQDLTTSIFRTAIPPAGNPTYMGPSSSAGFVSFGLNDAGQVAYWVPAIGTVASRIRVSDGVTTSSVFTGTAGLVPQAHFIAMNNSGHVAFIAQAEGEDRILVAIGSTFREVAVSVLRHHLGPLVVHGRTLACDQHAGQTTFLVRYDGGDRIAVIRADPANQPPVATDFPVDTNEDIPANGTLPASDPENDPLTFAIASNGTLGTAVVTDASTGAFTYAPNADVSGTDTFTFTASDGGASSQATVTVTITPVNDAPQAFSVSVAAQEDTPASFTLQGADIDSRLHLRRRRRARPRHCVGHQSGHGRLHLYADAQRVWPRRLQLPGERWQPPQQHRRRHY